MSPCGSFIPFMKGMGRGDLLWWFSASRAVCTIGNTTVGALIGGLYGAAVALAVVNAVITLLYSVLVFRVGGISAGDGLRAAGVPLLPAAAMAVLVRLLQQIVIASFRERVVQSGAS